MARRIPKGKLKPEDEFKIIENYDYLVDELDAKYLTSFLFSKRVIDGDDKDEIETTKRRTARNKLLLNCILNCGSGNSFGHFIEALNESYDHVARRLQETRPLGVAPVQTPYSWFEDVEEFKKNHVINDSDASRIAIRIGKEWEILMYRLGLSQIEIEHERSTISTNPLRITRLLIKWRQKVVRDATVGKLISCLMELADSQSLTIDWEGLRNFVETIEMT